MGIKFWLLILGTVFLCAILNRIRGGGLGGDKLPGRAIFYVAPLYGAITLLYADYYVAAIMAATYLFWGLFAWGHTLGQLGGFTPPRPKTLLEDILDLGYLGAIIRMMFVAPGVAAISWYLNAGMYATSAFVFAFLATHAYKHTLFTPDEDSWQNAELLTGAIWAITLIFPLLWIAQPAIKIF